MKQIPRTLSLTEARAQNEHLIDHHLNRLLPVSDPQFEAKKRTCTDTRVIIIPENETIREPIIFDQGEDTVFLLIIARSGSSATIFEQSSHSLVVEVHVEENASVQYTAITKNNHNVQRVGIAANGASLVWNEACLGQSVSWTTSILEGESSSSKNRGIFLGTHDQKFDVRSQSIHRGSHSTSELITHGALSGSAHAKYRGLITILPGAEGCTGNQKEHTLLLSEKASTDALPILEIHNHDVKSSHGVSIGKANDEHLFYLMSRGLSPRQAKRALVEGFFQPFVGALDSSSSSSLLNSLLLSSIIQQIDQQLEAMDL